LAACEVGAQWQAALAVYARMVAAAAADEHAPRPDTLTFRAVVR
jgi:hypothetical protein